MLATLLPLSLLLITVATMIESPRYWFEKGFDITDGILQRYYNYNIEIDTSCKDVNLNQKESPYDYNGTVMSGYLKVNKGNSVLAFVFYGRENTDPQQLKNEPTILWLSGGPGLSSQTANLLEFGPFNLILNDSRPFDVVRNQYTWTKNYNILFMDQPVGTGLSYADPEFGNAYVTSMDEMAIDLYNGLSELYNNPNGCFQKLGIKGDSPLFVFGESYGGKYAPAIGEKILREARDNKGFLTGLKGVAIGDGFTNPFSTLSMMGEYAYNLGLLDYQDRSRVEQYLLNASYQNLNNRMKDLHDYFFKILQTITNSSWGVCPWQITRYSYPPLQLIDTYFSSNQTISLYKLNPYLKYNSQSVNVREVLTEDYMRNYADLVTKILTYKDVKLMIYTGQNDLICNTPGTLNWVEGLYFSDAEKFRDTLLTPWKISNQVVGFKKRVGNLELRTINNGGHLIPRDQPEVAFNMVKEFIQNAMSPLRSRIQSKENQQFMIDQ